MTHDALSFLAWIRDNVTERSGVLPIGAAPGEHSHVYIGGYTAKIVPVSVWRECARLVRIAWKPGKMYELTDEGVVSVRDE